MVKHFGIKIKADYYLEGPFIAVVDINFVLVSSFSVSFFYLEDNAWSFMVMLALVFCQRK